MKPERELSPEEVFERLSAADKAAAIHKHQTEVATWYGNCRSCGARIEGKLTDIAGKPCPKCGFGSNGR